MLWFSFDVGFAQTLNLSKNETKELDQLLKRLTYNNNSV